MKAASSDSDGDGDMFAVQLEDRQIEEEENRTISLRHKLQPYKSRSSPHKTYFMETQQRRS